MIKHNIDYRIVPNLNDSKKLSLWLRRVCTEQQNILGHKNKPISMMIEVVVAKNILTLRNEPSDINRNLFVEIIIKYMYNPHKYHFNKFLLVGENIIIT